MNRQEIYDFVISNLAEISKTKKDELKPETDLLKDLKADSVMYFPLIAAIEEEFDFEIQYQDFRSGCRTIQAIVELIESEM